MSWDKLIAKHKALIAERASAKTLACIEDDLIKALPSKKSSGRWKADVFAALSEATGCSRYDMDMRRTLFTAGWPADPLWVSIEQGMRPSVAVQILRDARRRAKHGNPAGLRREIEISLRAVAGLPVEEEPELPELSITDRRDFWSSLRKSIADHSRNRLAEVPEHERDLLVDKLLTDLKVVIDRHQHIWYAAAAEQRDAKKVSRQRFLDALRALHLDPPKRLQPLKEVLEKARKQQRTLARQYHPDRHGGSERTRPQYESVINAYSVVEQYARENDA